MNPTRQPDLSQTLQPQTRRQQFVFLSGITLLMITGIVLLFANFFAPYGVRITDIDENYLPPQRLHFLDPTPNGKVLRPHVYGHQATIDPRTFEPTFAPDLERKVYLQFFVHGDSYRLPFGLESDLHLWGAADSVERINLLGTDSVGRDLLSRILVAAHHSLVIGMVTIAVCTLFGWGMAMAVRWSGLGNSAAVQRLRQAGDLLPTWILRITLWGMLIWQWPMLGIYVRMILVYRNWHPVMYPVLPAMIVSAVALGLVVLLLNRRLLVWFTMLWATLLVWNVRTLIGLARRMYGAEDIAQVSSMVSQISALGIVGNALLLMAAILPGLLLVALAIGLVPEPSAMQKSPSWITVGLPVLLFLLALFPFFYAVESPLLFFGFGHRSFFPMLSSLTGELMNVSVVQSAPWLYMYMIPPLMLMLIFTPVAERLLQRMK